MMLAELQKIATALNVTPELLALFGIGLGVLIGVLGVSGTLAGSGPAGRRMRSQNGSGQTTGKIDILNSADHDPTGIFKAFVPNSRTERIKITRKMRQAGIQGKQAVFNFYLVRTMLAFLLPSIFIGIVFIPETWWFTSRIAIFTSSLGAISTFQILTALIVTGFFGPSLWLKMRITKRRKAIELSLPNALDLLQVSIEAGLGFDSALHRVAREIAKVAPDLSDELTMLQLEIQAGKERDRAFMDMAARTDVEEVAAFCNVILQSAQFGTSVSKALNYFSEKMRLDREIRAQEMANKLPVKMSGIMAGLMMPTLLMICLSPVLIRWISTMTPG